MEVRTAHVGEIDAVAQVWFDAWQDAHAAILPPELTRLRTLPTFVERIRLRLSDVRCIGPVGAPLGFCMIKDDELYQLFGSAGARGSGVAASLLGDGETRLATKGVETAWLACAIGNDRAARFYEKSGWRDVGNMINPAETPEGVFPLEVWRFEKRVRLPSQ